MKTRVLDCPGDEWRIRNEHSCDRSRCRVAGNLRFAVGPRRDCNAAWPRRLHTCLLLQVRVRSVSVQLLSHGDALERLSHASNRTWPTRALAPGISDSWRSFAPK